ncbi:hypothetical protein BC936DRAFT_140522 [Jimgerdemannia flammicorona]|uniref:SAM domain-containing protein n=1 Tax=Jimgerdemannia flammicorona TaxID=994334 RepID=A0A433ARU3_9FUNG|nr:hypothetical protein BC936DRAFT_140522 [Jimgerdemannia flammicorona]
MQPLSITDIQGWNTDELINHLRGKLDISERSFTILKEQEIDGDTFLKLTQEELERWGMAGGPAKKIVEYANKLKGTCK